MATKFVSKIVSKPAAKKTFQTKTPSKRAAQRRNLLLSAVIGGILLVVGLVTATLLVSQSQDVRQQASGGLKLPLPTPPYGQTVTCGEEKQPLGSTSCASPTKCVVCGAVIPGPGRSAIGKWQDTALANCAGKAPCSPVPGGRLTCSKKEGMMYRCQPDRIGEGEDCSPMGKCIGSCNAQGTDCDEKGKIVPPPRTCSKPVNGKCKADCQEKQSSCDSGGKIVKKCVFDDEEGYIWDYTDCSKVFPGTVCKIDDDNKAVCGVANRP